MTEHGISATHSAGIVSACGIDTVITGGQSDLSSGNRHMKSFQSFVAFFDQYHPVCNGKGIICMKSVISGSYFKGSAVYIHRCIGVDGIVCGINDKASAQDQQVGSRLDSFHAGALICRACVLGRRIAAKSIIKSTPKSTTLTTGMSSATHEISP